MAELAALSLPVGIESDRRSVRPLPFQLEYTCPPSLSHRPVGGTSWPFEQCGPHGRAAEGVTVFLRRRYLETLFLPEILMPLRELQADIARIAPGTLPAAIGPLLLSLKQLERRHRTILRGLMSAISSCTNSTSLPEVKQALLDEAVEQSGLQEDEVAIIKVSVEMRAGSRRATESVNGWDITQWAGELEKREALIQALLLFHYIPTYVPAKQKKRKKLKHRDDGDTGVASPLEDPSAALSTLMDRLSIWSALADMSLEPSIQAKEKGEDGWAGQLKRSWHDIIAPTFIPAQLELCASFHQKIFASPLPTSYLPPPVAPARPSIPTRDQISRTSSLSVRSASRAPSETSDHSHTHSASNTAGGLHRSRSRTSDTLGGGQEMRRSRSRSIDPAGTAARTVPAEVPKRPLIRAPSGKDLFKGREVGLMRRTASRKSQESLGVSSVKREESQSLGLLGRKTSDPKKRRVSNEGREVQSQAQSGTIVFATPAKPRYGNPFSHRGAMHHPTPIREESTSAERPRPSFIAETPSTDRVAHTPIGAVSRIAETPHSGRKSNRLSSFHFGGDEDEGDDDLGDLMVMTDDEGEDTDVDVSPPSAPARGLVPETPDR